MKHNQNVLVLGHRGASALCPENTIAAFSSAMDAGADGVELDVRLCGSGELIVFHDDDLHRLCGDRRRVQDTSWCELTTLRVAGEPIPSMDEVFTAMPDAYINIELKKHPLALALSLSRAVVASIGNARAENRVLLSSFDPRLLVILKAIAPSIPRALLYSADLALPLRRAWFARGLGVNAVHPQHDLVTTTMVERWHRLGVHVNTWTIDDPLRIQQLAAIGVDAIITNDPKLARQALSE